MSLLRKEEALYQNNGVNLEPIEVKLVSISDEEDMGDTFVKLIPLTRAQIKEFYKEASVDEDEETGKKTVTSTKDADAELITKHVIDPSFTKKELEFLKPRVTRSLVYTILQASEQDISGLLNLSSKLADMKEEEKLNAD